MFDFEKYKDTIAEIADKAVAGDYGENPFEPGSDANSAMQKEAWERIGQFDPDNWLLDSDSPIDGPIMEAIRDVYDSAIEKDALDNSPDSFRQAWAEEQSEARAYTDRGAPTSKDAVLLQSDNIPRDLGVMDKQNETRIAAGEKPLYLENSTIEQLAGMGIDASRFKDPDSPPLEMPVENNGNEVDHPVETAAVPEEIVPASNDIDGEQNADGNVAGNNVAPSENDPNPAVDKPEEIADPELKELMTNIEPKYDEDGNLIDLVSRNEDGDETSLADMLAAFMETDPDGIGDIYRTALDPEKNGGNPVECFSHLMEGYLADKIENKPDVETGETIQDPVGAKDTGPDATDDSSKAATSYQERFDYHKEKIEEIKAQPIAFRGDMFKAYHEMEQVYAAFKGGIEMNGKVPDAVDFGVSVYNFLQSNVLETLIVYAIRTTIQEFSPDKVDNENPDKVVASEPTDKHGFREDGTIDHSPDKNTVDAVGIARKVDPVAGTSFGADMSQVDKRSTPDVTIRSTNPDGMNGRGVQVTLDNADKFTFPDVRLVDIKGTSMLVDPFGKVLDVIGDSDKYHVGQTLGGKLDVSGSKAGAEALETYARDNGISIDQAKIEISVECQERFAERIESTFKPEAKAIEAYIIPRELETRAELNTALATIEKLETMPDSPVPKEELEKMKADILAARDTLDGKIESLRDRVLGLEASARKPTHDQSISDRFSAAVSSEKNAIGRSVLTVDLGVDRKKMDAVTQKGIEAIKDKVSTYNATRDEMDRISYDPKTGSFVDRFGINDKGEYVGNKNGQFMAQGVMGPETAEQRADWIKEHFDESRFDMERIFGEGQVEKQGVELNDPSNQVDQPAENQVDPNNPNAQVEKDPTKIEEDPSKVENDPSKVEVDPSKVETDQTQIEADPTKLDAEPNPDAQVENNEAGIEAKPDDPVADPNPNDTEIKPEDTGVDFKPEEQPLPETEANPNEVETPQNPDDAIAETNLDTADVAPEDPAAAESIPDETALPDETTPDEQVNPDIDANENDEANNAEDTNDATNDNGADDTDTDDDDDDAVALDENEETDTGTDKKDDPAAEEESDDQTEINQNDNPDDETQPDNTDANNNPDQTENNDVAAVEDDADDDSDPVAIGDHDDSEENVGVSAKNAVEGVDEKPEDEEKPESKPDENETDHAAVEKFQDLLGDLGEIIDKVQSGESIGEAALENIQEKLTAKIDEIKDLLAEIKDADTLGDIMDICSDKLLDYATSAFEAQLDGAMDTFDMFKGLFNELVDAFGPENGNDLCSDVVMRCNDPDMAPEAQSTISEIAQEARPSFEVEPPDVITADGMNISNDSVTSAETDADVTDFGTPEAVENFIDTVEDHVAEEIQETIDQVHGDISTDDTPVDTPAETPAAGVENESPDVEVTPDDLGAGDNFDPAEGAEGDVEEVVETLAEFL